MRARVFGLLALAVVLTCCSAYQRDRALRATLSAVNTTRDAFVTWDAKRQSEIVAAATSLESGRADLATYRARRVRVVEAFADAYRVLAIAVDLKDDRGVAVAVQALRRALEELQR